jgi:hypothetical protein
MITICVRGIELASFYNLSTGYVNCSDSVDCFGILFNQSNNINHIISKIADTSKSVDTKYHK